MPDDPVIAHVMDWYGVQKAAFLDETRELDIEVENTPVSLAPMREDVGATAPVARQRVRPSCAPGRGPSRSGRSAGVRWPRPGTRPCPGWTGFPS